MPAVNHHYSLWVFGSYFLHSKVEELVHVDKKSSLEWPVAVLMTINLTSLHLYQSV